MSKVSNRQIVFLVVLTFDWIERCKQRTTTLQCIWMSINCYGFPLWLPFSSEHWWTLVNIGEHWWTLVSTDEHWWALVNTDEHCEQWRPLGILLLLIVPLQSLSWPVATSLLPSSSSSSTFFHRCHHYVGRLLLFVLLLHWTVALHTHRILSPYSISRWILSEWVKTSPIWLFDAATLNRTGIRCFSL